MTAIVLQGDARHLPLPDASVDLIVTSPPFWGQRDYRDAGQSMPGQIGSEATWQEWLANLLNCTREWVRVLKPDGNLFVELGDKFSTRYSSQRGRGRAGLNGDDDTRDRAGQNRTGYGEKCLLDLPHRYSIACVDQLGLIKRANIVWHHTNGLPESVTDRVRVAHTMVFHLVRQPRYYTAIDEIREPQQYGLDRAGKDPGTKWIDRSDGGDNRWRAQERTLHPLGKLPGSVWSIPSQPLQVPAHLGVDHYAAWPMEVPRRLVLGWSPPGVCVACGQGRRPVHDGSEKHLHRPSGAARIGTGMGAASHSDRERTNCGNVHTIHRITGYVCACTPYTDHPGTGERHRNGDHPSGGNAGANVNAGTRLSDLGSATRVGPWREYHHDGWTPPPTRPAIVLDPFSGTGTAPLVASMLGRIGIGVDRSADYCHLAAWRVRDPGERAKALQVPKPPPIPDGQDSLFPELA